MDGSRFLIQGRTRESPFSLSDSSRHGISPGHLDIPSRSRSAVRSRCSRSKGFLGTDMHMVVACGSTGDLNLSSRVVSSKAVDMELCLEMV